MYSFGIADILVIFVNSKLAYFYIFGAVAFLLVGFFLFGSSTGLDADSPFSVSGTNTASIVVPGESGLRLGESERAQKEELETLDIPKEFRP